MQLRQLTFLTFIAAASILCGCNTSPQFGANDPKLRQGTQKVFVGEFKKCTPEVAKAYMSLARNHIHYDTSAEVTNLEIFAAPAISMVFYYSDDGSCAIDEPVRSLRIKGSISTKKTNEQDTLEIGAKKISVENAHKFQTVTFGETQIPAP